MKLWRKKPGSYTKCGVTSMSKIKSIPAHILKQLPSSMGEDWYQYAAENLWWGTMNIESLDKFTSKFHVGTPEEHAQFLALHKKLLSHGGLETCFPACEPDAQRILDRGYLRNGTALMMPGEPSHCHSNVCNLWEQNRAGLDVHICTGYALSKDGLWRCHSWLLHAYNTATQHRVRVVETTEKRIAYFGFEMTDAEAEKFCDENY